MEFIEKYRRLLSVLAFVAVTILIAAGLYQIFFKSQTAAPDNRQSEVGGRLPDAPSGPAGTPVGPGANTTLNGEKASTTPIDTTNKPSATETAQGGLTKTKIISQDPVIAPQVDPRGQGLKYYNRSDGRFYRIDDDGQAQPMSEKTFYEATDVTWSKTKNKAIIEYPDSSKIVFDFDSGKQVTLPKHWTDFDFSPVSDQMVVKSIGLNEDNRWLAIANDDGSQSIPIEPMGNNADAVTTAWSPNNLSVALYTQGKDFDNQEVYFVGKNQENFKSAIVKGRGVRYLWSPDGENLLYSAYSALSDYKPSLWLTSAKGDNIGQRQAMLNVETWADKCAFADKNTIYCGVPKDLEKGSGIFKEMSSNTDDLLYRIDLSRGTKDLIAVPEQNYSIKDPSVSPDASKFYFRDERSGQLIEIRLR